ncbi:MAG: AAA-like domain-containing protein [Cyanobacteria bacterium J06623_1]
MNYIFSGTLPKDTPTYIERQADRELYQLLKAGKFCYIFNSRKMGKSSLRVRVMSRLQQEGYACGTIDLSLDEVELASAEQWYFGMLYNIVSDLNLKLDLDAWWDLHPRLSPLAKLRYFIETVLLSEITSNIVIFIDEIDSVLSLNFPTDDFFAFIRGCYNSRADNPSLNRFGICLLGVATPSALIDDRRRTPFNIGQRIELTGFDLAEAQPLLSGLKGKVAQPQEALNQILFWTGGQPFLTQKLCYLLTQRDSNSTASIQELVQSKIIQNWEYQDEPEHLRTIRDRLLDDKQQVGKLLDVYQHILADRAFSPSNNHQVTQLLLSGLVVTRKNQLQVYNPIYATVFDPEWIERELANLRPYAAKFSVWLTSQQDSDLLDKQELKRAQQWAVNKSLSDRDYQYLNASLSHERTKIEREAETIVKSAQQQAKKQKRASIIFSLVALAIGSWAYSQIARVGEERALQTRISMGEDILLNPSLDKKAGAKQYRQSNFASAYQKFKHSRRFLPQDPERLIYQNNARFADLNPLAIAVSVPIGKNSTVAQEILRGVAQAQEEINYCKLAKKDYSRDCGIRGRPLQVKIVDDDNEPEIARLLARQLVEDRSVLGVVGHNASDVSLAAAKIYQGNLVMISPTSFFADWTQVNQSPQVGNNYIFRTVTSLERVVEDISVQIERELQPERPTLLICFDSEAINSRLHLQAFKKFESKIDLIDQPLCDFNSSNPEMTYDRVITQAIAQGANSLFLAPHINRINEATEIARVNYRQPANKRLRLFAGPSLYTSKTLNTVRQPPAIVGMQLTVPWYADADRQDPFMSQAKILWGDRLNSDIITWRTATAYDATIAIIKGLQALENPSRQGLQTILSADNFAFQGATGKIKFQAGERISRQEFLLEIKPIDNSSTEIDFVPISGDL